MIAAVVDELTPDVVLCLTLWSTLSAVALSVFCHGSYHPCALRVDQGCAVRCDVCAGGIVGHLELPFLIVQVPDSLFFVTRSVLESGSVARLQTPVVLVLKQFVLFADNALFFGEVRLKVCKEEFVGLHGAHITHIIIGGTWATRLG